MLKQILNYLQKVKPNLTFQKMAESLQVSLGKRAAEADSEDQARSQPKKKQKKQPVVQLGKSEGCKRKIAMLVAYNGAGYYGVQVNPGFRTIESEFFPALVKVGAIRQDHADTPSKMWFQRGSRTDKGVSAVVLVPDLVVKLNEVLPTQIRVIGYVRTTNGFDSKNWCDSRTYTYTSPTFAFAPLEKFITDEYRTTPEIVSRVRAVLSKFLGTHKFHNFTSGVKYEQASAARYLIKFECSEPFVREGIEFVTITVQGQSFMLHHIRKMIGLTIAILRGYCGESAIESSWAPAKVDIPKAPGLGLVLETLHVDAYNRKFGKDGAHEPIDWSKYQDIIDKFREEQIISYIVSQEKTERVMFNWLRTLQFHNFDQTRLEGSQRIWANVIPMLSQKGKQQKGEQESSATPTVEGSSENSDILLCDNGENVDQENISTTSADKPCSVNTQTVEVAQTTAVTDKPCSVNTQTVEVAQTTAVTDKPCSANTETVEVAQTTAVTDSSADENYHQKLALGESSDNHVGSSARIFLTADDSLKVPRSQSS